MRLDEMSDANSSLHHAVRIAYLQTEYDFFTIRTPLAGSGEVATA